MYIYIALFIVLAAFAVYEYIKGKTQQQLYWFSLILLAIILCFRYGQGTDYFNYYYNYLLTPPLSDAGMLLNGSIHGEIGWLLLCSLFRTLSLPFELLIFLISVFEVFCLHRFISKYSPFKNISLLLAFPTLFMTYAMSILRQGLALFIFLGFMIDWLYQKKWLPYLLTTFICTLLHSSALVFLILFALRWFAWDSKKTVVMLLVCTVTGFAASWFLPKISSVFATYDSIGVHITAIGERLVSTSLIVLAFKEKLDHPNKEKDPLHFLLQIYLCGSAIYCFLMWNALISARFAAYFKAVEIVLFAVAVTPKTRLAKALACYLLAFSCVMYFKNVYNYLQEGQYFDWINVFNYPYVSIFAENAIESFRVIPFDFSWLLN